MHHFCPWCFKTFFFEEKSAFAILKSGRSVQSYSRKKKVGALTGSQKIANHRVVKPITHFEKISSKSGFWIFRVKMRNHFFWIFKVIFGYEFFEESLFLEKSNIFWSEIHQKRSPDPQIFFGDKMGQKAFWKKLASFYPEMADLCPKKGKFRGPFSTLVTKVT